MTTARDLPATVDAALAELEDEFEVLGDWEERYRHVIDLGRYLAPLTDAERTDANKVRGCASQVWLVTQADGERLQFRGDSDAHIVRGLIAILMQLYSGRTPAGISRFRREGGDASTGSDRRSVAAAVERPVLDG